MTTLRETTLIRAPIERCFDLSRSIDVHLLSNTHFQESAVAIGGRTTGLMKLGERVTWRAKHFWVWHELTSEITALHRPVHFQDVMAHGIFRSMVHDHYFRKLPNELTEMRDVFVFAAPFAGLGRASEILFLGRYMCRLLRERNEVIRGVAESDEWRKYLPPESSPSNGHRASKIQD